MRIIQPKYRITVKGKWLNLTEKEMIALRTSDPKLYDFFDKRIADYQCTPIAYTLLHGRPCVRPDGTPSNEIIEMVNDETNDLVLLTAPNQVGKSTGAAVYTILRAIPCDPAWPCFTENNLKCPEWTGAKRVVIASYTWDRVRDLWETYRNLLPRKELGRYAPNWGQYAGETGSAKLLAFRFETKQITLACGTVLIFLCYRQSLAQWTGTQADIAHLDEQCPETHFDELVQRQLTRGDFTPIIMSLTGHVIPDRPDTGAAGWIKRKIVDGGLTKGRKLGVYKISMDDVPEAIMSKDKKLKAYKHWVEEPKAFNDEKKQREAEARYYGGWEVGGGIVISEWNPLFHMIAPFDYRKYDPTFYRLIDDGQNPCASAIFAVMPWGDAVMIKEYYEFGKNISSNCQGILAMCGNERKRITEQNDGTVMWTQFEEIQCGMVFRSSEMDGRSFQTKAKESGRTIGALYNMNGVSVGRACTRHDKDLLPILKEVFALDAKRKHINVHLKRPLPVPEMPHGSYLYIFNTCTNVKKEIENFIGNKKDQVHLIDCIKYFAARERPYFGTAQGTEAFYQRDINNETGY